MDDIEKFIKETAPKHKFDLRTHIRDKNGNIIATNFYRASYCKKSGTRYERPVGSGKWYKPSGAPCDPPPGYTSHKLPKAQEVKKDVVKTESK